MPDIELDRQTHILVSSSGLGLFPSPNIYPSPDLYPEGINIVSNIVAGTLKLDKILYDEKVLSFGILCSDKFEVTLYDTEDLSGKFIYVYQTSLQGGYTPLFSGIVESCKEDRLQDSYNLIAYDLAYWYRNKNVASWWESFWVGKTSTTLRVLRESLCTYLNIRYENVQLPNDDILIHKNVILSSISFGDMIKMICELNCCFPHFNAESILEFIIINPENNPTDVNNNLEGENCNFEKYITNPITGVNFYTSADDLKWSVGDTDNAYIFGSNILILDMGTDILENIGEAMIDYLEVFIYTPGTLKLIISDFSFGLGDYVQTDLGNLFAIQISYSGSMLINQTIKAPGEQNLGESTDIVKLDSIIVGERFRTLTATVEGLVSEIGEITPGETVASLIEQTSEQVVLKVQRTSQQLSSGTLRSVKLNQDASQGAEIKIVPGNLQITATEAIHLMSGGTLDLTSESIQINSTNFQVSTAGILTCYGANINSSGSGSSYSKLKINDGVITGYDSQDTQTTELNFNFSIDVYNQSQFVGTYKGARIQSDSLCLNCSYLSVPNNIGVPGTNYVYAAPAYTLSNVVIGTPNLSATWNTFLTGVSINQPENQWYVKLYAMSGGSVVEGTAPWIAGLSASTDSGMNGVALNGLSNVPLQFSNGICVNS